MAASGGAVLGNGTTTAPPWDAAETANAVSETCGGGAAGYATEGTADYEGSCGDVASGISTTGTETATTAAAAVIWPEVWSAAK